MLKRLFFEFLIVTTAGFIIFCSGIFWVANNTSYIYAIEIWNYGREYLHVLYPFVFTAPFCRIFFYEKKGNFWKNINNRENLNVYIRKRIILMTGLSSLAMFIVSFGSLLFAYAIAPIGRDMDFEPVIKYMFYGSYQIEYPIIYAFLLSSWRAVLTAIYTLFSVGVTMVSKNIFISMTGAFIYSIVENFVTAILQFPEWSICTSFYPNRLKSSVVTFPGLLAGALVLGLITVLVFVYCRKKEKAA